MIPLITIVILIAAVVLGFFVLIQAPKGGGLTGSFGSISTQMMGVKQSGNVMEKGTWVTIAIIAALCLTSVAFIDKVQREEKPGKGDAKKTQQTSQPAKPASAGNASKPAGK